MQSNWSDLEAKQYCEKYQAIGFNEDIALRVYTSRLLGSNQELVLHGGGNTSVKTQQNNILNEDVEVLCVKGSGWDLANIEPAGLPAVELYPLLKIKELSELSDEAMVSYQRSYLLDFQAPNPSIETMLHAFLPHKFVDHTHANAILSITNQKNAIEICKEIYGSSVGIVPYIKPGFLLAKKAAEVFENNPSVNCLILLNHGIFTFADTAKLAYESMIKYVSAAERYIETKSRKNKMTEQKRQNNISLDSLMPIIRGACALLVDDKQRRYKRFILSYRCNSQILDYVNGEELDRYSQVGVVTPDHIIRTKNYPLILNKLDKPSIEDAIENYKQKYVEYFSKYQSGQTMLDLMARVILVPGIGLFGLGVSKKEADICADIAENTIKTITDAETIGIYQALSEAELFEMEYWSLEQAKISKLKPKELAGKIAVITGGAGTIGLAVCKLLQYYGATVVLLDNNRKNLQSAIDVLKTNFMSIECNILDASDVQNAFKKIILEYGGVDILVSNAGAAWQGEMVDVADSILRQSFELNFFAHQTMAKNAVKIMLQQETGGVLIFNVSKQALQPGHGFGPYGIAKAATLALSRQYALEYGRYGIRSNSINADRIRSGLLTDELISERAKARKVDINTYMEGNLLNIEVQADDVAKAILDQILAYKTTAGIATVDGGNIAAAVR